MNFLASSSARSLPIPSPRCSESARHALRGSLTLSRRNPMAAAGPDTAAEREARAGAPLEASADGLLHLLPDAHAHPQLDVDNLGRVASLRVPCVAAMGVAVNVDWGTMERLAQMAGEGPGSLVPWQQAVRPARKRAARLWASGRMWTSKLARPDGLAFDSPLQAPARSYRASAYIRERPVRAGVTVPRAAV